MAKKKGKPAASKTRRRGAREKAAKTTVASPSHRAVLAQLAAPSMWRMAAQRQALQARVARDRATRYAAYVQQLSKPTEPPGGQRRAMIAADEPAHQRLRILAEGDSWFEYPNRGLIVGDAVDGVIYQLQNLLGYPIANMAHHGEEVRQMLGLNQRREIISRLSDPNVRFDALLFSGGGNDLVGDQFCIWLRDEAPGIAPEDLLYSDRLQDALGCVEAGYRDLIDIRDTHSADTAIFLHGYDFPPVTGIGVCGNGPWLKPSLDFHKVAVGNDQFRVVRALLEQFQVMIQRVAATSRDVTVVPTQGTLIADQQDWQNEIHPSSSGFAKIAVKFQQSLQTRFP
jgi:hypothetical protein